MRLQQLWLYVDPLGASACARRGAVTTSRPVGCGEVRILLHGVLLVPLPLVVVGVAHDRADRDTIRTAPGALEAPVASVLIAQRHLEFPQHLFFARTEFGTRQRDHLIHQVKIRECHTCRVHVRILNHPMNAIEPKLFL